MNPSFINSFDKGCMEATFRLSNAALQYKASCDGPWKRYEELLATYVKEVCAKQHGGTLYVYTGTALSHVKEPDVIAPTTMTKPPQLQPGVIRRKPRQISQSIKL